MTDSTTSAEREITIDLDERSAHQLVAAFRSGDQTLAKWLEPCSITNVQISAAVETLAATVPSPHGERRPGWSSTVGNEMVDPAPSDGSVTAALQEIESFFATPESTARFLAFAEEILRERLSLRDIMGRKHLHAGVLEYDFERMDLGNRVLLLRINGELFGVRIVTHGEARDSDVRPVVEKSGIDPDTVVQFLECAEFVRLWRATCHPPDGARYNTVSSIQPYTRALVSGTKQRWHGLDLYVESVLGAGLEGTVFLVREASTRKRFALKKTYKDLEKYLEYWELGFRDLRREAPHVLPYLCEFYSYESHEAPVDEPAAESIGEAGMNGSSLLMQYVPLTSLEDLVGGLSDRHRLRKGLRIIADTGRVLQTLWRYRLYHGDVGVSNTFVYPTAGGGQQTMLIDPHPDVAEFEDTQEEYRRKDLFGLAHMLYWLVTNEQWPEGTFEYREQFVSGQANLKKGKEIFRAQPLSDDFEYQMLHAAAVAALAGGTEYEYELALELILARANR